MPDLITHMSVNYILLRLVRKSFILVLVMLGAILPDLVVAFQITLIELVRIRSIEEAYALNAFSHTIIGGVMLSLAFGVYFRPRAKAVLSLLAGYLLHLALDLFQKNWGRGNLLFYPFSFTPLSVDLFTYGMEFKILYIIPPLFVFLLFFFAEKEKISIGFRVRDLICSLACLAVLVLTAAFSFSRVMKSDYFYLNFRYHPEQYDGKVILMNLVQVEKGVVPRVYFRKQNLFLRNIIQNQVSTRFRHRIRGIYRHRIKAVEVRELIEVRPYVKPLISGLGLLLFVLFLVFRTRICFIRDESN